MTSLGCFEEGKDGSANGKLCRPARVECDRYGKSPKVIYGDAIANGTANVRLPLVLATKRRKDSAPDDAYGRARSSQAACRRLQTELRRASA